MAPEPTAKRAGFFETLGAWLHIWTPPRDVDVPPVPWRRLALFGVPALAAVGLISWVVLDNASEKNQARDRSEARGAAARAADRRARLRAEQAVHRAQVEPSSKTRMVAALEAAVLHDAQERVKEGGLERRVRRVECVPHPRTEPRRLQELDPSRRRGRYHCLAVNREVRGTARGSIGYPFLAKITYPTGALVWCKINPVPGEQLVPDPRTVVQLPRACR